MGQLGGMTGVVVGASRGLGRGVAERFSAAGVTVVAVARTRGGLEELASAHPRIQAGVADATDPAVAGQLLGRHQPDILALVAGDAFVTIATAGGGGGAYALTGEGLTKLTDAGR